MRHRKTIESIQAGKRPRCPFCGALVRISRGGRWEWRFWQCGTDWMPMRLRKHRSRWQNLGEPPDGWSRAPRCKERVEKKRLEEHLVPKRNCCKIRTKTVFECVHLDVDDDCIYRKGEKTNHLCAYRREYVNNELHEHCACKKAQKAARSK